MRMRRLGSDYRRGDDIKARTRQQPAFGNLGKGISQILAFTFPDWVSKQHVDNGDWVRQWLSSSNLP